MFDTNTDHEQLLRGSVDSALTVNSPSSSRRHDGVRSDIEMAAVDLDGAAAADGAVDNKRWAAEANVLSCGSSAANPEKR